MTVGAQLQQARTARKLSLSEVTRETKIQPWILEAMEADQLPALMSPVYVKGFLSTYARFLHLDPVALVAQVKWPEAPESVQESTPPPAPAVPVMIQWPSFTWPRIVLPKIPLVPIAVRQRLLRVGLSAAVIAGLIVINPLRWMPKGSLADFKLPKWNTSRQVKVITPKKKAAKPATPAKQTAVKPAAKPAPKPVAKAPVPVSERAQAAPKPAIQAASVTSIKDPLQPPPPPTLTLLATQPLELTVTAHQTTWIQVKADGKLVSQQRLSRGAKERWSAKKQFELIISKPTQVELSLNGQPISPFAVAHQGRVLITHHGITRLPER